MTEFYILISEKASQDRTSKQKRDSSKSKRGTSKKSTNWRSKKVETEDENSQEVPDSIALASGHRDGMSDLTHQVPEDTL